jgi:signal transduction histidine kinase
LQMTQLFYNLLNNSLKFSRQDIKPRIVVQSKLMDREEVAGLHLNSNVRYRMLKFTDNGIGFNKEYSERIFTIFQRLNSKENYPGTGIGLALCKKVVDNHRGLIFAEGNENKGAAFTIVLPEKQSINL